MARAGKDGNVRQLAAVIRRTAFLNAGDVITAEDLRRIARSRTPVPVMREAGDASLLDLPLNEARDRLLEEFQRRYCVALLDRFGDDLGAAAEHAGYSKKGLRDILRRVGLADTPT